MSFLSACMYVLVQHRLLLMFVLPLGCLLLAVLLHIYRGKCWGYFIVPTVFTLALINVFIGQWLNAGFLNWFGTSGTAMIVDKRDAGWLLNEQRVYEYDVLLRTADNQDIITQFDDMTASIWPPRNLILLPTVNDPFVVKYIPGFPRNIAIMSDQSAYGKRWLLNDARRPVERARNLHHASLSNVKFAEDYRRILQAFLNQYEDALSLTERRLYEDDLKQSAASAE
ncbi:hypothetical protein ACLBWZ_06370 [Brucellaceae bacterium C25G]